MRLKITMRQSEHPDRRRNSMMPYPEVNGTQTSIDTALMGKNEGTIRFLFRPPGLAEPV
jgi:CTD kinase subunit beta